MKIDQQKLIFFIIIRRFPQIKCQYFFMLKTIDDFRMQILNKVKCLGLIKPIMATKINSLNRKIRKNPPHEIVIQDKKDDEKSQNIINYDVNNKIQIKDSIVYYYQKKKVVNFVSTNEKQFMSSIF